MASASASAKACAKAKASVLAEAKEPSSKRVKLSAQDCYESMLMNMQSLTSIVHGLTSKVESLALRVDAKEPKPYVTAQQRLLPQIKWLNENDDGSGQTLEAWTASLQITQEHVDMVCKAVNYKTGLAELCVAFLTEPNPCLRAFSTFTNTIFARCGSEWTHLTLEQLLPVMQSVSKALFRAYVQWRDDNNHILDQDLMIDKNGLMFIRLARDGWFILNAKPVVGKVDKQGVLLKQLQKELYNGLML